jgi:hypothetical protein
VWPSAPAWEWVEPGYGSVSVEAGLVWLWVQEWKSGLGCQSALVEAVLVCRWAPAWEWEELGYESALVWAASVWEWAWAVSRLGWGLKWAV